MTTPDTHILNFQTNLTKELLILFGNEVPVESID